MSDAGRPPREWLLYMHDMIKFGERVLSALLPALRRIVDT